MKVVFLNSPPGVGKLTLAKELPALRGLRLALHVSAVIGLSACGLYLTGTLGRSDTVTTPGPPTAVAIERPAGDVQFVYYVVDSQEAATNAVIAESVTAQERLLAGIVAPERIVRIIDNSDAGRMTAAEAMLVAR